MSTPLVGRRALITGGGQGLGLAIAARFLQDGASVFLCGRNADTLRTAVASLREDLARQPNVSAEFAAASRVESAPCDVSRPEEVERTVAAARRALGGLDVLICNAGINGAKGPADQVDWDEWQETIATNLFGTVLCCRAVMAEFKARGNGKIILLSGGGATNARPFFSAYAASKAAIVRFGETIAEELRGTGVDVNSVAPGAMNTRLLDDMLDAGPARIGEAAYAQALKQKASGGTPPEKAAALCAFLASRESDGITGRLISAAWDPWETLATRREALHASDIYTLRRIVPEDRGQKWT